MCYRCCLVRPRARVCDGACRRDSKRQLQPVPGGDLWDWVRWGCENEIALLWPARHPYLSVLARFFVFAPFPSDPGSLCCVVRPPVRVRGGFFEGTLEYLPGCSCYLAYTFIKEKREWFDSQCCTVARQGRCPSYRGKSQSWTGAVCAAIPVTSALFLPRSITAGASKCTFCSPGSYSGSRGATFCNNRPPTLLSSPVSL